MVKAIVNTCLRERFRLHYIIHLFCAERVKGKVILELKMAQELESVDLEPLFLLFQDPWKAYDTVDHGRLTMTLDRYSSGSNMCRLLEKF